MSLIKKSSSPIVEITLSVVIPVMDELESLRISVAETLRQAADVLLEIVLVVGKGTSKKSRMLCEDFVRRHPNLIRCVDQNLPHLGGALRAGIHIASGSHVLILFSDLESDPAYIGDLINQSRKYPEAIVQGSRWLGGARFEGYNRIKKRLNYFFQKFVALLFCCRVTDFTYGFRIYPRKSLTSFDWLETRHVFVMESILRPLLAGWQIIEIPTKWKARKEGAINVWRGDYYNYPIFTMRLRLNSILKKTPQGH